MRFTILILIVATLAFGCARNSSKTTANSDRKYEYKEPEKLEKSPAETAEQAKHDKWKEDREAHLKKLNDDEQKRLAAIRKCESDRLKKPTPKPASSNTESELEAEPDTRPCEEIYPPVD